MSYYYLTLTCGPRREQVETQWGGEEDIKKTKERKKGRKKQKPSGKCQNWEKFELNKGQGKMPAQDE